MQVKVAPESINNLSEEEAAKELERLARALEKANQASFAHSRDKKRE